MTRSPEEAPAGVGTLFFPRPSSAAWAEWCAAHPSGAYYQNRPVIAPRLVLIHTNGASEEAHVPGSYNYAMAAPGNTKPHYQVDRDGTAAKFLPSNRQGIANYQADPFSLSIETADLGWPTPLKPDRPGGDCGFTPAQAETLARIVAFETELWGIPIDSPAAWDGNGVGAHTEPFTYPYWTKYQGKPCPGWRKKIEVRELIMPRAREIRYGTTPPPEEDMSTARMVRNRGYLNVWLVGAGPALHLSPELAESYARDGVATIVQDHPQSLKAMLAQSGLTTADLVPGGG